MYACGRVWLWWMLQIMILRKYMHRYTKSTYIYDVYVDMYEKWHTQIYIHTSKHSYTYKASEDDIPNHRPEWWPLQQTYIHCLYAGRYLCAHVCIDSLWATDILTRSCASDKIISHTTMHEWRTQEPSSTKTNLVQAKTITLKRIKYAGERREPQSP